MNTHTPGPWHYLYGAVYQYPEDADDPNRAAIAQRCGVKTQACENFTPTEKDANMRLIAAAPDMLDALKALTATARTFRNVPPDSQEWTALDDDALDAAFAAIKKATDHDR